ncbi:hypothetical protein D0809_22875 [Flavobacterium circumlabens]|uniref:Uncharacterized protein n=1 Tax=Flavobacterium circumlabens TaxID=2133765 RepID=A0A4Y7U6L2_9FLAO|nr:hypothetical protein D0809_22875 [Flavobacterium circumlabens]
MKNFFIYCWFNGYLINKNNFYSKYIAKNLLINFSLTNTIRHFNPIKKGSALLKKRNLKLKNIYFNF